MQDARPLVAGYSGTPLAKKLGIREGCRVYVENAPDNYLALLAPLPPDVSFVQQPAGKLDLIHLFTRESRDLAAKLERFLARIAPAGMIWVSWPKRAAKVPTDVTEDMIREVALPLGLVDVKVCAVDETWSGLKLVIRRENRKA
jgi:hypothetical protein